MRSLKLLCLIVSAMLIQLPVSGSAVADNDRQFDESPRFMFYATKSFGDSRAYKSAPKFGLRFERTLLSEKYRFDIDRDPQSVVTLAEFRWTKGYGQSLMLTGVPVATGWLGYTDTEIFESKNRMNPIMKTITFALAGAAVLCLAETIICEDSSSDDEYNLEDFDSPLTTGSD